MRSRHALGITLLLASMQVSATAQPTPLDELARTFVASDARTFRDAAARIDRWRPVLAEYARRAPLWPADPKLESVFVISLAEDPLLGPEFYASLEALALLRRHRQVVRRAESSDAFECAWYRAEMALMQGTRVATDAVEAVGHGLTRCPDDPRLVLGLALANDRIWSTPSFVDKTRPDTDVLQGYNAAFAFPETVAEAGVRSAYLAYRLNRLEEAARRVDISETADADVFIRHFGHVVRSRVLLKQDRYERAIEQLRAALVLWPESQSTRVQLMAALLVSGARSEAEVLSESIQGATSDAADPPSFYWHGDYRAMRSILTDLRERAR